MRLFALLIALVIGSTAMAKDIVNELNPAAPEPITKTAIFAGGCFWCMQPAFDALPGVLSTRVGYTGGADTTPTYEEVSSGTSGHVEAIEITYDENRVTYDALLDIYWQNIDPTDEGGQFADRGSQYQTAIFYADDTQKTAAETSKTSIAKQLGMKVATRILPAKPFYAAEEHHQQYYKKNAGHYTMYKYGSGRVRKLEQLWGEKVE